MLTPMHMPPISLPMQLLMPIPVAAFGQPSRLPGPLGPFIGSAGTPIHMPMLMPCPPGALPAAPPRSLPAALPGPYPPPSNMQPAVGVPTSASCAAAPACTATTRGAETAKTPSRIVSMEELAQEMCLHHDSEEMRKLIDDLRTQKIDLRDFCSRVRRSFGMQVLFDTVMGLRETSKQQRTKGGRAATANAAAPAPAAGLGEPKHSRSKQTILVHALFCSTAQCPVAGCRLIKETMTPFKAHALECSDYDGEGGCVDCGKWQQLQRLKDRYRRKLAGIAKAPSTRHGAGGRSPRGSLPGISRHRLDGAHAAGIARRILSHGGAS